MADLAKLAEDLEDFRKSQDGNEAGDPVTGGGDTELEDDKEGDGPGVDPDNVVTKSMTLADGTVVEFVEGGEMLKAMGTRIDALVAENAALKTGFEQAASLLGEVVPMLKSLGTKVDLLGKQGSGRKAVLELPAKNARENAPDPNDPMRGMTPNAVMAKAMDLMGSGEMIGADIAYLEASLNAGQGVPRGLHGKIFAAAGK